MAQEHYCSKIAETWNVILVPHHYRYTIMKSADAVGNQFTSQETQPMWVTPHWTFETSWRYTVSLRQTRLTDMVVQRVIFEFFSQ